MTSVFADFPPMSSFLSELDAKNAKSIVASNSGGSAASNVTKSDVFWTAFSEAASECTEISAALSSASGASSTAATLEAEAELSAAAEKRDAVSAQLKAVKAELAGVMEKMAFRQSKVAEMREKVANREGTLKEHRDTLESYCKNCKSLLGLDFAPTDRDSTILQMTAIDPDDREKTFECELSHSAKEGEKQFTGENTSQRSR